MRRSYRRCSTGACSALEPLVFSDRLNHASMHFGCAAAGAREIRYRHGDAAHLAALLSQYQGDERPKFILTESVFSMDGDMAPLAEIGRLARAHDAMLIVDDAHATGILGRGRALACPAKRTSSSAPSPRRSAASALMSPRLENRARLSDQSLRRTDLLDRAAAAGAWRHRRRARSCSRHRCRARPCREPRRALSRRRRAAGLDTGASTTQIVPVIWDRPRPCSP